MGNNFEHQTHNFYLRDKQSLFVPPILEVLLARCFKTPGDLFGSFKRAFEEDLLFTFLLKKEDFIQFTGKYFGFNIPQKSKQHASHQQSQEMQNKGNNNIGDQGFLAALKQQLQQKPNLMTRKPEVTSTIIETQQSHTTEGDDEALDLQAQLNQQNNDFNEPDGQQEEEEDKGEIPLAKKLFKIFQTENQTQGHKVINMLELFTSLILLADFSSHTEEVKASNFQQANFLNINQEFEFRIDDQSIEIAAEKTQSQNDLIEHKVNLLILLFSFRENQTLNISEIIIMAKTALRSLQRVFPAAHFFKNQKLFEEIRTLMVSLFQKRIEDQLRKQLIKLENQRNYKIQTVSSNIFNQNLVSHGISHTLSRKFPTQKKSCVHPYLKKDVTSLDKNNSLRQEKQILNNAKAKMQPKGPIENATWKKGAPSEMNPNIGFTSTNAQIQPMTKKRGSDNEYDHESIEDKKERLFKWNTFQTVKFTQDSIKETFIQNINVLRFLNLLESFDNTVMSWGSNNCLQFGLHLKRDLQKYYTSQVQAAKSTDARIQQELILQQIVSIKNQMNEQQNASQYAGMDLKNLLNLWQNTFTNGSKGQYDNIGKAFSKYERKMFYKEPQFMFSLLNTQITGIYPNDKFTIYQSQEGVLFSTGQDFRQVSREDLFGIPRELRISGLVKQISVGQDHALILTQSFRVFALGSNLYGQLGVNKNTGMPYHFHPLTRQKLYFAQQPIEISFFSQGNSADEETILNIHIAKVGCGDCFSVAVSTKGEVYTWGMGTQGQLGITLRKGMISNIIDADGIQYSRAVQKVKGFDKDPIDQIYVGSKHTFALSNAGNFYFWGQNHSGLGLIHQKRIIEQPLMIPSLKKYGFTDMATSHDHVLALGPSIEMTFHLGDQVLDSFSKMQIHAYHLYSEKKFENHQDLARSISAVKLEPVVFLNDFDIPYYNLIKNRFPMVRKNKKKRYNTVQQAEEEEDDEDQDNEDDDDDDGQAKGGDGGSDDESDAGAASPGEEEEDEEGAVDEDGNPIEAAEGKTSKARAGDNDDEEDSNKSGDEDNDEALSKKNTKKHKKKSSSPDHEKKQEKQTKKKKKAKKSKKKKRTDSDDEEESSGNKYEPNPLIKQLTPEEQRRKKMNDYQRNLNQRKNYFRDLQEKIPPAILEVNEADEDNELYGMPVKESVEANDQGKKVDKKDKKQLQEEKKKDLGKKKEVVKKIEEDEDEDNDEDEKEEEDSLEEKEEDEDQEQDNQSDEGEEDDEEDGSDEEDDERNHSGEEDDDDEDDEESDEDVYIKLEREYVVKSAPVEVNAKKLQKVNLPEYLTKSKLLFANYMAADYQYTLKKLLSIVDRIYENLRYLIISIPPDADSVDSYYANLLCQEFELRGVFLQIFFINDDKKQALIDSIFARDKKHFKMLPSAVSVSFALSDASLIYTWGSARKGKLGLNQSYSELKKYNGFYTECMNLCAQQEYIEDEDQVHNSFNNHTHDSSYHSHNHGGAGIVNQYNNSGMKENLFTIKPQPVLSLLGQKIKQMSVGREHCLVVTALGQVYAWGDNSKHQLGLPQIGTQDFEASKKQLSGLKISGNQQQLQQASSKVEQDQSFDKLDSQTLEKQLKQINQEHDLQMYRHVIGTPQQVKTIQAKVNFVACGHHQSYASVKLL